MSQPVASPRTNRTGRTSPSSSSSVTVILRHRLPPLLGKPFGGCAGLVYVGVGRDSHEQAVEREADACKTASNLAAATNRTASLTEDCVADSVAEVDHLLGHHLELLVGGEPVFEETTDRGRTRVDAKA